MTPTRFQVLALYKQLIKNARAFSDYNFRNYFIRRIRYTYKENKTLQDTTKVTALYNQGLTDLGMLKRQCIISRMYTFDKLVVEPVSNQS